MRGHLQQVEALQATVVASLARGALAGAAGVSTCKIVGRGSNLGLYGCCHGFFAPQICRLFSMSVFGCKRVASFRGGTGVLMGSHALSPSGTN